MIYDQDVDEHTRHFTASMLVLDMTARAVLLVHHKASGLWQFPGGHVDPDESLAECAQRELHEETGIYATLVSVSSLTRGIRLPVGMVELASPWLVAEIPAPAKLERPGKPAEPPHSHLDHLFVGTSDVEQPLKAQLDEVCGAQWVLLDDLDAVGARAEVPRVAREAYRWVKDFS